MSFEPESFLERFVVPLVSGGELWVGSPLDAEDLRALVAKAHSPDSLLLEIDRLRSTHLRKLTLGARPVQTSPDDMGLIAAMHNILFLSHEATTGLTVRKSRLKQVVAQAYRALAIPPPHKGLEAFSRYTLTSGLSELRRTDVDLRFWIGHRKFIGSEPPARLGYWPNLRNVRQTRKVVRWVDTELNDGQLALMRALLSASPISDLISPERRGPEFSWPHLLPYLRNASICRFVCHYYLDKGLNVVGKGLVRAFQGLLHAEEVGADGNVSPLQRKANIRFVARLVQYLFACLSLQQKPTINTIGENEHLSLGALFVALRRTQKLALKSQDLADVAHAGRYEDCHLELAGNINPDFVELWQTEIAAALEN